ncbi:MAG: phytoene desaturase family protein, partial [Anaerolineae bacterium]
MNNVYDAIIIGAGYNGLVTAVQLAKSGKKVLVLERRDVLGGIAATEELFPGCKVSVGPGEAGLFADEIVQGLFLKMHGLEFRESEVVLCAPQANFDAPLILTTDIAQTQAEIARFSQSDAEKWPEFVAFAGRMTAVLHQMRLLTPPDTTDRQMTDLLGWGKVGLKLKGLGKREMMQLIRLLPLPVTDFLKEWFESDVLIGALTGAGVTGLMLGPGEAGTALMWLYQGGVRPPRFVSGGTGELAQALAGAAQADGAEIRLGTAVSHILVRDGKAVGVELANGEPIEAKTILSSADPRHTFFDLVGAQELEPRFMRAVRSIRFRGSTAQLHLLLNGLPQFGQTDDAHLGGKIVICPSADYLQTAYDEAKYGRVSTHPYLEIL